MKRSICRATNNRHPELVSGSIYKAFIARKILKQVQDDETSWIPRVFYSSAPKSKRSVLSQNHSPNKRLI